MVTGAATEVPRNSGQPLRTLDVVVWMKHRASHRPSRCPGLDL